MIDATDRKNAGDDTLKVLAQAAGLSVDWTDAAGRPHTVSDDTLRTVLAALGLPGDTPSKPPRAWKNWLPKPRLTW